MKLSSRPLLFTGSPLLRLLLAALLSFSLSNVNAHSGKRVTGNDEPETISWNPSKRLSWDDFKGAVPDRGWNQVAAITSCGIGYYTSTVQGNQKPEITVYNSFYTTESWVRPGDNDDRVLRHEQGHFDLCEIYTRMMRTRIAAANITGANMKQELRRIYNEVDKAYQDRQQAYEDETGHGTDLAAQDRWLKVIASELATTDSWASAD